MMKNTVGGDEIGRHFCGSKVVFSVTKDCATDTDKKYQQNAQDSEENSPSSSVALFEDSEISYSW